MRRGPDPATARITAILIHGRGGSAEDILSLASEFRSNDVAYIAPQAAGSAWYPNSFLFPINENEPNLSSALRVIEGLVSALGRQLVAAERIAIVGFSQGACLALEYAARHAQRYRGIVALSGGLIGRPALREIIPDRWTIRLCFWDAATSIRISRSSASANLLRCSGASALRWMNGFIPDGAHHQSRRD